MARGRAARHTWDMKTRQKVRRGLLFGMFALLPVTLYYLSPMLPLSAAAQGIVSGSLLVFAAQLLLSLFLGRLFCGWACPAGGLQEIVLLFRRRPVRPERIGWITYLVWVPWLAGLVYLFLRARGVRGVDFFYQTHPRDLRGRACRADRVPQGGSPPVRAFRDDRKARGLPHNLLDGPVHGDRPEGLHHRRLARPRPVCGGGALHGLRELRGRLPGAVDTADFQAEQRRMKRKLAPLAIILASLAPALPADPPPSCRWERAGAARQALISG
jgi:hypothetical protein